VARAFAAHRKIRLLRQSCQSCSKRPRCRESGAEQRMFDTLQIWRHVLHEGDIDGLIVDERPVRARPRRSTALYMNGLPATGVHMVTVNGLPRQARRRGNAASSSAADRRYHTDIDCRSPFARPLRGDCHLRHEIPSSASNYSRDKHGRSRLEEHGYSAATTYAIGNEVDSILTKRGEPSSHIGSSRSGREQYVRLCPDREAACGDADDAQGGQGRAATESPAPTPSTTRQKHKTSVAGPQTSWTRRGGRSGLDTLRPPRADRQTTQTALKEEALLQARRRDTDRGSEVKLAIDE